MLSDIFRNMSDATKVKDLEHYLKEYLNEDINEMGLRVVNHEGGGGNVPDESTVYDSRVEWLEENDGPHENKIWKTLAKQTFSGKFTSESPRSDDEELVYISVPFWFVQDDDDLSSILCGNGITKSDTFGILKQDICQDTDGYAFRSLLGPNNQWNKVANRYNTLWIPKSLCTLYIRNGEPSEMDKKEVAVREALPDGVDRMEAGEGDYDWGCAVGELYRRCETGHGPVDEAYEAARGLTKEKYEMLQSGVDEFMRQNSAENRKPSEDELAMVIKSLVEAVR